MRVSTDLAAIYMLGFKNGGYVFMQDELDRAKQAIYNMNRDGKLFNHGGSTRGRALWDLAELHKVLTDTQQ